MYDRAVALRAGTHRVGHANGTLQVRTYREGLAQRVGHDLIIDVGQWEAAAEVREDGTLSARYWSEAAKERKDPSGIFYYWKGERPRHANAPQLDGTGEIRLESADRAAGYWTTRSDSHPEVNARTSGVYLRANPEDMSILDGRDDQRRAELIAERLTHWKSTTTNA